MHTRSSKSFGTRVSLALVLSLSAVATLQAQDFAGGPGDAVGGDGNATTVNDVITSTTPDALRSVTVTLPNGTPHNCAVFGSSDNVFGGNGTYIFGLRDGNPNTGSPVAASERRIEFTDNPDVNDESFKPVATNFTFSGLTGSHTFHFSARKNAAGNADMTATNMSISAICVRNTL